MGHVKKHLDEVRSDQLTNFKALWTKAHHFDKSKVKNSDELLKELARLNPEELVYKIFCASLGCEVQDLAYFLMCGEFNRPTNLQLIPNNLEDYEVFDLGRINFPEAEPLEIIKDPGFTFPEAESLEIIKDPGFTFTKKKSAPKKSWTLQIGTEQHELTEKEKIAVHHLLEADEPQSREQLTSAGIQFHAATQMKLMEIGLLETHNNPKGPNTFYYSIRANGYPPETEGNPTTARKQTGLKLS